MALDLGTLTAYVEVDDRKGQQTLAGMARRLQQFARQAPPDVQLGADGSRVERVTEQAREALSRLADTDTVTRLNADAGPVERALDVVRQALRDIPDADLVVDADTSLAARLLAALATEVRSLPDGTVEIEADTERARRGIRDVSDEAESALGDAGEQGGEKLGAGVLAALVALPIAGTAVGIGAALGASLVSGLQNEVRGDLLAARSGLDEATVAKIGRAAGEAYAANFGVSIEDNLESARIAIASGLLDPAGTQRDSQAIIEQLSGVADVLGVDVLDAARAAGQMIKTGLAKNADEAFDALVRGYQLTGDLAGDLSDTLSEYSVQFAGYGLSGAQAVGLISQALDAGARDTDVVADAFKELGLIAREGAEPAIEALNSLGVNAGKVIEDLAAGGPRASAALDLILDRLRTAEGQGKNTQAVVTALFGGPGEDLGAALFALDLSKVSDKLGVVEGAAKGAVSALGDNAAGQIESAQRNIEVAADGIKGALAAAFGPQISEWAADVQENRAGVVQFLLDIANGAFDVGRALVEAAAVGIEGFGKFVGDTVPDVIFGLLDVVTALDAIPGVDMSSAVESLSELAISAARVGPASEIAADALRTQLIDNGIAPAQAALNDFGIKEVTRAELHDATLGLANDIADVGYAADGTKLQLDGTTGAIDRTTESGGRLDAQIRVAVASLEAQLAASARAGEGADSLTGTFNTNRDSLIQQIQQLGFSRDAAERLANKYGAIPSLVQTTITANAAQAAQAIEAYQRQLGNIPRSITTEVFIREVQRDDALAARLAAGSVTTRAITRAGGGWILGPGSGTSDSVPVWGSNGEFVVKAAEAGKNARLLEAINAGRLPTMATTAQVAGPSDSSTRTSTVTHNYNVVQLPGDRDQADAITRELSARAVEYGMS